jgi:adenylosuccinate lyase
MLENFERSYGLIFSQAILLALTQKGLAREEAYQLVQRNAMQSWKERVPLKTLVQNDSQIRAYLSEKEIEQIFSSEALMKKMKKNVDYIFRRVGLAK